MPDEATAAAAAAADAADWYEVTGIVYGLRPVPGQYLNVEWTPVPSCLRNVERGVGVVTARQIRVKSLPPPPPR